MKTIAILCCLVTQCNDFLTAQPGAVYFHVSSLPNDTKVRIDWIPPSESDITSYEVAYIIYEANSNVKSSRLNSDNTSYVIENLSK